jgi:predicted aspartyl protease
MNDSFNPERGLVVVQAEVFGPAGSIVLRLALDTGATATMLNVALLTAIGYDPSLTPERIQVTTGSGVEFAPCLSVDRIDALGQQRDWFRVLAHTLPPSASVDGLLGLDFLRGHRLTVDFRIGAIALA